MKKININCIVCDQVTSHIKVFAFKNKGNVIKCKKCAHISIDITPDQAEISDINTGMYKDLTLEFNPQKYNWAKESVQAYLKKIPSYKGKSLLDVGGGLGYYSKAFEEAGLGVTLLDLDEVSTSFAKQKLDLKNVHLMTTETFLKQNPDKKFDIIFCRHIIEHLEHPKSLINDIYHLLKKDGCLIIETDNNKSYELLFNYNTKNFYMSLYKHNLKGFNIFKFIKNPIFVIDPPRHLQAFRVKNLKKMIEDHGLEIKTTLTYPLGSKFWPNIPNVTFKQLLIAYKTLSKRLIIINTYNFFLTPIRIIMGKLGMGAGILMIANKK